MDPTEQAFLLDLVIYLVASAIVFALGFCTGRAGKRTAYRAGSRDMEKLIRDHAVVDFRDKRTVENTHAAIRNRANAQP